MSESFREELRRALAADALTPEPGVEDRLLHEVSSSLRHTGRRRRIKRLPTGDDGERFSLGWALIAAIVAIIVVATLLVAGQSARSRSTVPARPAPSATSTSTGDPAVTRYRALVEADFAPLHQAGDLSANRCQIAPTASCRMATAQARQSAQDFLDALSATSPPPGFEETNQELVAGLRELVPAYDAQLVAIDSGDAELTSSLAITSVSIKAQKVYRGVVDAKCWPRRAVPGSESQQSWVCPSS